MSGDCVTGIDEASSRWLTTFLGKPTVGDIEEIGCIDWLESRVDETCVNNNLFLNLVERLLAI
jgi:hypothetical protein